MHPTEGGMMVPPTSTYTSEFFIGYKVVHILNLNLIYIYTHIYICIYIYIYTLLFHAFRALCSFTCVCAKSLQSCLALSDPKDCSPSGSSVHGFLQATLLEWVAMPSSWILCLLHWQADSSLTTSFTYH